MNMDSIIIALCLVAAVLFIGVKAYRAVARKGGCACGCNCASRPGAGRPEDVGCASCRDRMPRN